ncbi:MAG TPA: peptidylprolyl isomerase [Bryobacteraceae bacterium]|nr:peptidylprolyl isomerase [Bryobacteraceae bacterium]
MKFLWTSILLSSALLAQTPSKRPTHHTGVRPSLLNPASLHARAPELFRAQFTTTKGDFIVEVHRDWAPLGADRFYNLVKYGFFTNAAFFRVLPGFVAQFGLSANPAINKAWEHASIKDDPVKEGNKRGNVVFATAGPNTRTTQLFINFSDNTQLDPMGFAAFGSVVQGMEVVDMIYSGYGQRPDQDRITNEGDAYLVKNFPMIDKIKLAKILPAAPPTPAAAPADKK